MTTSWAYATHGQWANALQTHVSGTLLAPVAAVVSLAAIGLAARGRYPAWRVNEKVVVGVVVAATGLIVCEWIVRVMAG
jgi:type IV secretory pathway VirB2 component (pilin)